ncbi:MAG: hypothetical protein CMP47_12920 [Rickettsiales bacterium]|nr:hypothetical protein [Rickettsiales bacterium]
MEAWILVLAQGADFAGAAGQTPVVEERFLGRGVVGDFGFGEESRAGAAGFGRHCIPRYKREGVFCRERRDRTLCGHRE